MAKQPKPRPATHRRGYIPWHVLMRQLGIDVETCPRCGGKMKIIALVRDPQSIARYLRHLGLPTEEPSMAVPTGPRAYPPCPYPTRLRRTLDPVREVRQETSMVEVDPRHRSPWWKGGRGEWYVVVQVALFGVILFGPRAWPGQSGWSPTLARAGTWGGLALMVAGGGLMLAAFFKLGRNLTPLPYPRDGGQLVERGAYALVRHPIYCGGIALAFGWGLLVHGVLTLGYATLLLLFLDVKSRREERWLRAKFPTYPSYQQRVRKLIPFVY